MLKNRLLFGTIMVIGVTVLILVDAWLDGSLTERPNAAIQAGLVCALLAVLLIAAQFELAGLLKKTGAQPFLAVTIPASLLLATCWFWSQLSSSPNAFCYYYLLWVLTGSIAAVLLYQALKYGTSRVVANCGANCFAILYLGILAGFVLVLRIRFGPWILLIFLATVKSADIGAYTFGSLLGKRKFSPVISPGKTWEGMAGAVLFAALAASIMARLCDIMSIGTAIVFAVALAFVGQLGDLAESMIKRDAEQKDAANKVPGFGGILDVIDSPLLAAPFAYLFFLLIQSV